MLLIWFCIAFLLGIVGGDALQLPASPLASSAGLLIMLAITWWSRRDVRLPLLLAAAFLLGASRMAQAQPTTSAYSVWLYTGRSIAIRGVIVQQPDRREDKQTAVLLAEQLMLDGTSRAVEGQVLLRLPPNPELHYGQRVLVAGRLEQPKAGDDFDYRAYLARHNVYALMQKPKLTLLPGEGGVGWQRAMLAFNDAARRTGLKLIAEPYASLLVGILLGVQSTIPEQVLEAFSATGTSHILVISGWNISIIIVGVTSLLTTMHVSRKRAAVVSLPLIALYVVFVGATPSVVRAAVMGSLAVVAVLVDREAEAWTSLAAACVGMAIYDPNVLWDIGFQLSACATGGLFAFGRPIAQWLSARGPFRYRGLQWAVAPLTATVSASLLSLPILLFYFGRLSLIAPLANILMLPVVPYAMLFGALATLVGLVWLPLGQILALLAWPFLQWLLTISYWLAQVPGAYITLPPFSSQWVWSYYILVAGWFLWSRRNQIIPVGSSQTTP